MTLLTTLIMNNYQQLNDFPINLAPMVGLSHVALRKSLDKYFPKSANILMPTEMLNSRRLPGQVLGETPQTMKFHKERNLHPQILGNDEKFIKKSVEKLVDWGASAIDINMGCPVKKALKHNYGVALMGDINYAAHVVKVTKQSSPIPVSVKLRAGEENDPQKLLEFCEALCDAGADWLTLHPRLASEKRKGQADWSQIKYLKDQLGVPIIGNGDIQTLDDIVGMLEQTHCDAVMIGRALTCKPWIITQYAHRMNYELEQEQIDLIPKSPEEEFSRYCDFLIDFVNNCFLFFEPHEAMKRIRFFIRVGHVWINFGHSLVKLVHKQDKQQEIINELRRLKSNSSFRISYKTELRY